MNAELDLSGLTVEFGPRRVLDGVDLTVDGGEFVALLGANGSGKSTTLRAVAGLVPATSGTVRLPSGRPAMIFQKINLVARRTALDNVCTGGLARLRGPCSLSPVFFPRALREEAMGCLERVGLADRAHDRVAGLSGGQQQRVAVARALCQRARVILADEPVSALDPHAAEQVMRLLRSLAADAGLAVAAVLHQPDLALRHSDRVVGLLGGRIALDRPASALTADDLTFLYDPDGRAAARPRTLSEVAR